MDIFSRRIQSHTDLFWEYLPLLLYATFTFCFFLLLGYIVAKGVRRGLRFRNFSETYESFFLRIIRWIFGIAGFLFALKILGLNGIATSILASGGVTAIILGFAFRDIGENILAGFFLAFSRPFKVGDLIRSEGLEGRVKSVDLRNTNIRTGDGCDIFIPSSQIFTKPLHNYTRDGLRRANFTIGIDYADDVQQAIALLKRCVPQVPELLQEPAPAVKISGFTPNYVELDIAFWINTFKQEQALSSLKTEVMDTCRINLLKEGFTLSSNVSTSLSMAPLDVNLMGK